MGLQLHFWVAHVIWNSPYIKCNSLQLYQNNSFSIIMQLYYNYTHDVMIMSWIVIHVLKFDMWHYETFQTKFNFFSKY
jgi:hypothetical protein